MSRISSGIPIYALSRHESTNRKVNLYRGVFPIYFPTIHTNHAEANQEAVDLMKKQKAVEDGDLVRVFFYVPENDIAHAFTIDELGVSSRTIHKGESTVIEFVANQAGEFYYDCPLPSHRTLGMEGKLVVKKGGGGR